MTQSRYRRQIRTLANKRQRLFFLQSFMRTTVFFGSPTDACDGAGVAGRGRGNGSDDAVRWCWWIPERGRSCNQVTKLCAIPDRDGDSSKVAGGDACAWTDAGANSRKDRENAAALTLARTICPIPQNAAKWLLQVRLTEITAGLGHRPGQTAVYLRGWPKDGAAKQKMFQRSKQCAVAQRPSLSPKRDAAP